MKTMSRVPWSVVVCVAALVMGGLAAAQGSDLRSAPVAAQSGGPVPASVQIKVRSVVGSLGSGTLELPSELEDLRDDFKQFPVTKLSLLSTHKEKVAAQAQASFELEGPVTMTVTVLEIKPNKCKVHVKVFQGGKVRMSTDTNIGRDAALVVSGPDSAKVDGQLFYVVSVDYPK
jgi:hypothetical protein